MSENLYPEDFGKKFKEYRIKKDMTLRAFCREHGFDHGNMSKLERGRRVPPTGETLDRYLSALGLEPDSEEWKGMHYLASACAGKIPPEVMSKKDAVSKLPVVFRTLNRERPSEEELRELVELVRRS
ncbi:MAG: helix-turn-helix domain-containing protein [Candidatus Brocadiia bacterium]|nr:helix-turn-helix domain-containing protein [Planctomycetota bacterium]